MSMLPRLIATRCPVCRGNLLVLVALVPGEPARITIEQRGCGHRVSPETDAAIRQAAVARAEAVGE